MESSDLNAQLLALEFRLLTGIPDLLIAAGFSTVRSVLICAFVVEALRPCDISHYFQDSTISKPYKHVK